MAEKTIEYILKAQDNLSSVLNSLNANTEKLNSNMRQTQTETDNVGKSTSDLGSVLQTVASAWVVYKAVAFGEASLKAYTDVQKSQAALELVLRNTGKTSGQTTESLKALNEQIFKNSEYSKVDVNSAEKMLLAYRNIHGEIYDKALPAIADFAAFTGKDLTEATEQLGKALNDPVNGAQRLVREVPGLTKAMIEHLKVTEQTNGLMAAQKELLDDVAISTKGAAESALANDPWGQMNKEIEEIRESFGKLISEILKDVMPTLLRVSGWVKEFFDFLSAHKELVEAILYALLPVAAAITAIVVATKLWTAAQWLLNVALDANPIGLIIIAAAALIGIFYQAFHSTETFRNGMSMLMALCSDFSDLFYINVVDPFEVLFYTLKAIYDLANGDFISLGVDAQGIASAAKDAADRVSKVISDVVNAPARAAFEAEAKKNGYDEHGRNKGKGKGHWTTNSVGQNIWVSDEAAAPKPGAGYDGSDPGLGEGSKGEGSKVTTVNININGGIGNDMKIESANITEGAEKVKNIILETLIGAVRDSQIVAGQ